MKDNLDYGEQSKKDAILKRQERLEQEMQQVRIAKKVGLILNISDDRKP